MAKTRQQLEAEGWKIASVTGGTHLKRTLEMYRELGIEVYLEKVKPEECESCTRCFTENNEAIYRIYTRPHPTLRKPTGLHQQLLSLPRRHW